MRKISTLTMAKAMAGMLLVSVLGGGTAYAAATVAHNGLLNQQEAENFAFMDADVKADEVTDIRTDLEKDDGIYVYDIEFYAGHIEYEYEIRAEDGVVLEKHMEDNSRNMKTDEAADRNSGAPSGETSRKEETTAKAADQTAQDEAYSAKEQSAKEQSEKEQSEKEQSEKEQPAKEQSAKEQPAEEQSAKEQPAEEQSAKEQPAEEQSAKEQPAKEQSEKEKQPVQEKQPAQESSEAASVSAAADNKYISVDRAKQIALQDAGLKEEEVKFTTAKFEDDDGRKEYDVEFYCGSLEYEYEIDAVTGEILDSDVETEDD